ncbi:SulP family inorganic anion transporter [Tautonia marina]|uniref:SulP family inorganic anion transporter n=1 Tax=Tautonia marina TaxID=2653855 RepID=UPI00126088F7|nr:SulP family inorganic anion transporter [Tautonia marina]
MSQSSSSPSPSTPKRWDTLGSDLLASVVVFLVALPLCMGIAIASGAPVASGLITGIVGGLVVGVLAGSPLQVSGPAAGLTVIVYEAIQQHGLEMLGLLVLIAGAAQLVAGMLRFGQWFRAVSPAVIKGMLAGIGILIFASQFHVMVDDSPKSSGIANLLTIPEAIEKGMAWPNLGSEEERAFKTEQLRQIGELHRRQERLWELTAERLPDHATIDQWKAESPERHAAEIAALRELLGDQETIVEELEALPPVLHRLETLDGDRDQMDAVERAAAKAADRANAAADDLRLGNEYDALASQNAAVDAIEDLLVSLKSHNLAAGVGLLTILIIVVWDGLAPKRWKVVPATLLAIIVVTALTTILKLPVLYVEVPTNLLDGVTLPTWSILSDAPWSALLSTGLVIAAIASAETLLCATAVDQMHQGPRTRYDRELTAQGVGNMLCGLFGALPMTGVIVRSSANIQAGGKTRLSAILHGFWLLVFVVGLAGLLRLIPTASLAAMLVYIGYRLVDLGAIRSLRQYGISEVAIYAATVLTIVLEDLLTGVIVGIVLSGVKLLYTFSSLNTTLDISEGGKKAVLALDGAATFIRLPKLAAELERVPRNAELHIDMTNLSYIDHACLDLLASWASQHQSGGGQLVIDWESLHARFRRESMATPAHERTAMPNDLVGRSAEDARH